MKAIVWLTAVAMLAASALGPWLGDLAAFRYANIGLAVVLLAAWWRTRGAVEIPRSALIAFFAASLIWFETCAVTHFYAFAINGYDFSVFDWMLESTARGHFGYSPIYGLDHFGVHSTFVLLALVPLHAIAPSPLWLLLIGPAALWAGLFPLRRLVRWAGGSDLLFLAAALAYLASAYMGRVVEAGFRIEGLLPVFTLWFLVGWVEEKPRLWIAAAAALLLTKEDIALALICFGLIERRREGLALAGVSLAFLLAYVGWVQPALTGRAAPYAAFWSDFGTSIPDIALGLLTHPLAALKRFATSGVWWFFGPLLFLPWASKRAAAAMLPTTVMLGVATYELMHGFRGYYPIPLVAFALFGMLELRARRPQLEALVLVALLAFPLFSGGYARAIAVDGEKLRALEAVPHTGLVQTAILPHLGYDPGLKPFIAVDPNAPMLINLSLDPFPFTREQLESVRVGRQVRELPGGFLVVEPPH